MRTTMPLVVLYGMYAVGTASHVLDATRGLMLSMTPWVLLALGLFVMHPDALDRNRRLLVWVVPLYAATFAAEAVGVATGAVFGDYSYGPTLGLKALDVPLVIGFNWVLVVLGATVIARMYLRPRWQVVLAAAALTTAFDVAMEPVAMALDYWDWAVGHVPLQNYVAWFAISALAAASLEGLDVRTDNRLYAHYFAVQLVFFIVLNAAVVW